MHIYTAVLDYIATGEGRRFQVLVVLAVDEATARQAFLCWFYAGSPDLQDWFGRGVDIYPGVCRPALSPMLTAHHLAHPERTAENGEFAIDHVFNLG